MIEIEISSIEYSISLNELLIHVFGRDKKGKFHQIDVTGFQPYCYILVDDEKNIRNFSNYTIDRSRSFETIDGEMVYKVSTRTPGDVKRLRDRGYRVYEGDIPYVSRFLIDKQITRGIKVPGTRVSHDEVEPADVISTSRICTLDIECDDSKGFPDSRKDEIISITLHDSDSNLYQTFLVSSSFDPLSRPNSIKRGENVSIINQWAIHDPTLETGEDHYVFKFKDEKALLQGVVEYFNVFNPDIITGWNIEIFDIPYIKDRFEANGLNFSLISRVPWIKDNRIRGRRVFDLLSAYKRFKVKVQDSYKLGDVANREFGEDKLKTGGSVFELKERDKNKFVKYNKTDVELCVNLNDKLKIIEFYKELALFVGVPLEYALYPSNLIDTFILRESKGIYVLPTKNRSNETVKFQGAEVFGAVNGLFDNVAVFDLKSLYPMAMLTLNASFETKSDNGELKAPNGIRFKKNPPGLMRNIISTLLEERKAKQAARDKCEHGSPEWKKFDHQQAAIKIIMNSYYGVSGFAGFRLYDTDIAGAITSVGREVIRHTRKQIENVGYRVLYGDTDSCMVKIPGKTVEEVLENATLLEQVLNQSYTRFAKDNLNADEHYFTIRFEKLYQKFFQPGVQKRYAGHLVWEEGVTIDELDIVGFELRRSDSSLITRQIQERIFSIIFDSGDIDEVRKFIRETIRNFRKGEFSLNEIGIPGSFSKNLNQYDTINAHVRGALYSNDYLKTNFKSGDKPKRVYISHVLGKYPKTDVVCFDNENQVPKELVVDLERMMNLIIRNPLERILVSLHLTWEQVDPTYKTLFDF